MLFGIEKIWILRSDRDTGLKKNESFGDLDFLRYYVKGRSADGNLMAKLLTTFEKCLFKIFNYFNIWNNTKERFGLLKIFTLTIPDRVFSLFCLSSRFAGSTCRILQATPNRPNPLITAVNRTKRWTGWLISPSWSCLPIHYQFAGCQFDRLKLSANSIYARKRNIRAEKQ